MPFWVYKTIYILSGLGADNRVFRHLDLSGFALVHIEWLKPERNESMAKYAARLSAQITAKEPVLLGLSFGGMVATELAKLVDCRRVVLLSSAVTKNDIPLIYRLAGKIGLHFLIPYNLIRRSNFVTNWFFGVKSSSGKQLLEETLKDTDPYFLKWAIYSIVHWNNQLRPENLVRIHGTSDRIIPCTDADIKIVGGGHLMVVENAGEISTALSRVI
jgi:pimeloyl-ACP methyl ester carboxylesterase